MIGDPKEKRDDLNKLMLAIRNRDPGSRISGFRFSLTPEIILQIAGTAVQILLGLGVMVLGVLQLIRPVWLSLIFSILGSIATLAGFWCAWRIWHNIRVFDSLTRQAIRRVIEFRN